MEMGGLISQYVNHHLTLAAWVLQAERGPPGDVGKHLWVFITDDVLDKPEKHLKWVIHICRLLL